MKKIKITNNSQVYIYASNDSVLIVTSGTESPFYYTENLKNILKNHSSVKKDTTVYIDMMSCVENEKQRFIKLNYLKDRELFDTSSIENISFAQIPLDYKNQIEKIYLSPM